MYNKYIYTCINIYIIHNKLVCIPCLFIQNENPTWIIEQLNDRKY